MSSGIGAQIGTSDAKRSRRCNTVGAVSDARVQNTVTRLNVTYFSEILEDLDVPKREVIESYGFGSLLQFDKCVIPLPFSRWIA